ncbi:MAG: carotenoid biosynthesis protein [candidate division Zixibacteria bacterium]|nr:carotenoid biosynthesis protein [candidate division Zixibacteria bacterium]
MTPNFTAILIGGILFALPVLAYIWWRFGGPDTLSFIILSGGFTAIMDFISSFVARNYEYPGQSPLWVFTYIFFGWMGMCGSCLFLAEGILARPGQDMITQRPLWWQVPLLTAVIAVVFDLFIDPVAVAAGYWVWLVTGTVYLEIPLLNYVGWFVLMFLAPVAWIPIVRYRHWSYWRKGMVSLVALVPLCLASIVFSLILNGAVATLGLR